MSNKVKFGLKNAYYSIINDAIVESVLTRTYGTPVALPGVVNLTLDPKGEKTEFYADDIAYFIAEKNDGYEGSLEVALVPDAFRKNVLGWKEDANNVMFEDANVLPKKIALLFEFSGDKESTRHVLYDVTVSRPGVSGQTKGASIEVQPESFDIVAGPNPFTGYVKAKVGPGADTEPSTEYTGFFTAVYAFAQPTPPQG